METLDATEFEALFFEDADESCGMVLRAKTRGSDLCGHISQGLKVALARGHSLGCIKQVDITPCLFWAAKYVRAALAFQKLGAIPSPPDLLRFRQEHKIRPGNRWFSYIENHPFLGDYSEQVKSMERALGV
jgi:hypothetical protein